LPHTPGIAAALFFAVSISTPFSLREYIIEHLPAKDRKVRERKRQRKASRFEPEADVGVQPGLMSGEGNKNGARRATLPDVTVVVTDADGTSQNKVVDEVDEAYRYAGCW